MLGDFFMLDNILSCCQRPIGTGVTTVIPPPPGSVTIGIGGTIVVIGTGGTTVMIGIGGIRVVIGIGVTIVVAGVVVAAAGFPFPQKTVPGVFPTGMCALHMDRLLAKH